MVGRGREDKLFIYNISIVTIVTYGWYHCYLLSLLLVTIGNKHLGIALASTI